ncbi:GT-D fold domain-containing glycosyltransferase [Lactococcus cremoris]
MENNIPDIKIRSIIETADFIKKNKSSLVRFGDGEIDIINHSNIPYQPYSPELAKQLKNILETQSDEKCLVALPDVFKIWRDTIILLRIFGRAILKIPQFLKLTNLIGAIFYSHILILR